MEVLIYSAFPYLFSDTVALSIYCLRDFERELFLDGSDNTQEGV